MKMKRMINRLVKWMKEHGMTAEEIAECISYITQ